MGSLWRTWMVGIEAPTHVHVFDPAALRGGPQETLRLARRKGRRGPISGGQLDRVRFGNEARMVDDGHVTHVG